MSNLSFQPLVTAILAHLQEKWSTFFPRERRPGSLNFMLQGTGVGKIIIFIFANREAWPRCVVKIPRSTRDNDSLRHEYELVCELRRRGGEAIDALLPVPLASFEIDCWNVTVEQTIKGQLLSGLVPFGKAFNLNTAGQHLRLVRNWLVATHDATAQPARPLSAQDILELFLKPIDSMMAGAELRPPEIEYLRKLQVVAQHLIGREFPLSFGHGDLRPGNILISDNNPCVIDWQFGQIRALPMLDWFEFVFRYYCDAMALEEIAGEQDAYRSAFEAVYLGAHAYSNLVAAETQAYAQALRIPSDCLSLLRGLWLVSNTNKYLAFLAERAERGYLYLMQAAPEGSIASFRRQMRRQVYVCLLGQLTQHHPAGGLAYADPLAAQSCVPQAV